MTMAERWELLEGDCLDVLPELEAELADAVVCDPPYGLEFMGKEWDQFAIDTLSIARRTDSLIPYEDWCHGWLSVLLPVVKPGGYLLAFGGARTHHRLMCAIEDAGWEIRDTIMWVYGSGFPKGKGCLKPAHEPVILARRPGPKVLPLGIEECRVGLEGKQSHWDHYPPSGKIGFRGGDGERAGGAYNAAGRYPANLIHDGSPEVLEAFARAGERKAGVAVGRNASAGRVYGNGKGLVSQGKGGGCLGYGDSGTAARFFYCAKASRKERGEGNIHPTVKPLALIEYLVRLVCPEGGLVLDPFAGSGTTPLACLRTGRRCLAIEKEPEYCAIARRRLEAEASQQPLFAEAKS